MVTWSWSAFAIVLSFFWMYFNISILLLYFITRSHEGETGIWKRVGEWITDRERNTKPRLKFFTLASTLLDWSWQLRKVTVFKCCLCSSFYWPFLMVEQIQCALKTLCLCPLKDLNKPSFLCTSWAVKHMEILVSYLVAALVLGVATVIGTISFNESVFVWTAHWIFTFFLKKLSVFLVACIM